MNLNGLFVCNRKDSSKSRQAPQLKLGLLQKQPLLLNHLAKFLLTFLLYTFKLIIPQRTT